MLQLRCCTKFRENKANETQFTNRLKAFDK